MSPRMRVVYIAHPLGAGEDREQNRQAAAKWVAWAAEQGVAPIATWVTLSSIWDESRRAEGLAIDCALVRRCDELWLCGPRVSPGMQLEAEAAKRAGVPILRFETMAQSSGEARTGAADHQAATSAQAPTSCR